jgi:hypothetical protein
MSDPAKYAAYKLLVTKAAKEMGKGWTPREVQEAVWAATMGIGVLKSAGMASDRLVRDFDHRMARDSWDMEGFFDEGAYSAKLAGDESSRKALGDLASWARDTTASRRAAKGRVGLSEREKRIAEGIVGRIPRAATGTINKRKVHLPRGAKAVKTGWRRSRHPSRFVAGLPPCFDTPSRQGMRVSPPKYLTRDQVGEILSNQHWRRFDRRGLPRAHPKTPSQLEHQFAASTLYHLTAIPPWVARIYRTSPIKPGDVSHSSGPIIVDEIKDEDFLDKHVHGSFGHLPDLGVLDGNHRLNEHKEEHGDEGSIEAFVGTEILGRLKDWISDYGPKREVFISALRDFYADRNRMTWDRLQESGNVAGLSPRQLYSIWLQLKVGRWYDPASGEFTTLAAAQDAY